MGEELRRLLPSLHSKAELPATTTSDGMFRKMSEDDYWCQNCGYISFKSNSVRQPNGKLFCSYCNRLQEQTRERERHAALIDTPVLREFRKAVAYEQKLFREHRLV